MSGKPAAFVGRITQHAAPLRGPGVASVLIQRMPAWTVEMETGCPVHGPEAVVAGAETVLIGGKPAARAGDYLLGSGPPNRIMELGAADRVLIGSPAIGLMKAENRDAFCQGYCALKLDWPNLSPEERQARYEAILEEAFARFGAPVPSTFTDTPAGTFAVWDAKRWAVVLEEDAWQADKPPRASTTYHEIAHAQQTFMGMRARGGDPGAQKPPLTVRVSAMTQPIDRDTPEGRYAEVHAKNEIDQAGLDNRNRIIRDYHTAWGKNPDPRDPGVRAAAHAYKLQPGGQEGAEAGDAAGNCGC